MKKNTFDGYCKERGVIPLSLKGEGRMRTPWAAFTLAEVLITLTIIGVIAALTIPNLMQSYKKHEVEAKLKDTYSILSNALKMANSEYGPLEDIDISADTHILPYLKISDKKQFPSHVATFLNGNTTVGADRSLRTDDKMNYVLPNGYIISFAVNNNYGRKLVIHVDINGLKGPNKYGVDLFIFSIYRASCTTNLNYEYCSQGGRLVPGVMSFDNQAYMKQHAVCSGNGLHCAANIMLNGWKIPDNYPVKKW